MATPEHDEQVVTLTYEELDRFTKYVYDELKKFNSSEPANFLELTSQFKLIVEDIIEEYDEDCRISIMRNIDHMVQSSHKRESGYEKRILFIAVMKFLSLHRKFLQDENNCDFYDALIERLNFFNEGKKLDDIYDVDILRYHIMLLEYQKFFTELSKFSEEELNVAISRINEKIKKLYETVDYIETEISNR